MSNEITLDLTNKTAFERADVVGYFQSIEQLFPAERVIFDKFADLMRDSRLLDLGIGGGRTTRFLLDSCKEYTGIDYVAEFVEESKHKFPEANLLVGDARDLSRFEDGAFDIVLFSYNGLGTISHEGRLDALAEIHRVLAPGGTFIFSSHNRNYRNFNKPPWKWKFSFDRGHLIYLLHCIYHLPKHFQMKKHEVYNDEYALINDGDHRYALLFYYISIEKQREQLLRSGFRTADAYDMDGSLIEKDTDSHWVYYVTTKR